MEKKKGHITLDLNVKELRNNFDRIPAHIKYQKKLMNEVETVQFSLFLGLSNLELLQEEDMQIDLQLSENNGPKSTIEASERRSTLNKEILEPPKLKV